MKNEDKWEPSKFVYKNKKLIASRNTQEVAISSRLMADLIAEAYESNIQKYAKGKLLDLGCGKAPLYQAYRKYVTSITCADWHNTLHGIDYLDFICDLNSKLPFDDEEFDTIILSDVLEHIARPWNAWKEMARILAKDGKILMNVPFYYPLHEQPHDYYRYTEYALRHLANEHGLRVLEIYSLGGAPEIIADLLGKNLRHIPKIAHSLQSFTYYFTSFFIKTTLGRKIH